MSEIGIVVLILGAVWVLVFGIVIAKFAWKPGSPPLSELSEEQEHDLAALWKRRYVVPRATGQTITQINAKIENRTDRRIRVVITPGTCFVSTGSHQNMVTRTAHRLTLGPNETQGVRVPASCINAELPIPDGDDQFRGVRKVSRDLERFLESACGEDAMVVQAGVWALTDGYSARDVQSKLVAHLSSGITRSAVSDAQVARARQILGQLGIRSRL